MSTSSLTQPNQLITGTMLVPGSETYERLRNVFNQTGSPAGIVQAQTHQDIVEALRFAREQGMSVSVRSGGHGLSGQATNNRGLVLDLTAFNAVGILDPGRRLVRIGAGARWGEVAKALATHGLVVCLPRLSFLVPWEVHVSRVQKLPDEVKEPLVFDLLA